MYNYRLDTFLTAARTGSFSAAAQELFITPSAVMQQIHRLEREIGAPLFETTNHGVTLTPAGHILRENALRLKAIDRETREAIAALSGPQSHTLHVGTNLLCKPRMLSRLWKGFTETPAGQGISFETHTISPSKDTGLAELIEYIEDGEAWQQNYDFMPLTVTPIVLALSPSHPLADRERLSFADLRGHRLVSVKKGFCTSLDAFHAEAAQNGAILSEVLPYDFNVFCDCEMNQSILQIPQCWSDLCPQLRVIPGDWPYAFRYGFFYSKTPSEPLRSFLDYVQSLRAFPA